MLPNIDSVSFQARLRPEKLAAHDLSTGRKWTYREFDLAIARCARVLQQRDVVPGDRVACLSKNRVELVMLHLASARMGAIYVPLNWRLAAAEISLLLEDCTPKLLLGDSCLEKLGLEGFHFDELHRAMEKVEPLVCSSMDDLLPALILYTSGTTGKPKGAVLTERNLSATASNFSVLGSVDEQSVFLCDAPMFHVIGLVANVRPVLRHGGTILVSDGFEAEMTLNRLTAPEPRVTHYFCVPQMAAALRAQPGYQPEKLHHLTALFTGGAPHAGAHIRAWLRDGIAAVDGYGMSEAGTVCGMPIDCDLIDKHAGAVGFAPPNIRTRIVDAHGNSVELGNVGELLIKGPNVFQQYWNNMEATKAAFTHDGWFRTGDIARCDEDGFFWLVDRSKDMFISGGENVYPAEIEASLAGHPAVSECAVVDRPDQKWGEVGHLFLVPKSGANADPDKILAELGHKLARYKIPKYVSILDSMPRNSLGKIEKKALRQQVRLELEH